MIEPAVPCPHSWEQRGGKERGTAGHGDQIEEQALWGQTQSKECWRKKSPWTAWEQALDGIECETAYAGCLLHHKKKWQHQHEAQKRDFTKKSRFKKKDHLLLVTIRSSAPKTSKNCKKLYWDKKRLGKSLNSHKTINSKILRLKEHL